MLAPGLQNRDRLCHPLPDIGHGLVVTGPAGAKHRLFVGARAIFQNQQLRGAPDVFFLQAIHAIESRLFCGRMARLRQS